MDLTKRESNRSRRISDNIEKMECKNCVFSDRMCNRYPMAVSFPKGNWCGEHYFDPKKDT